MDTLSSNEKARIETRVSKSTKDMFERAAALAGYNTLTDFVLSTVKEKAETIIEKHETILATERDRKVFFEALENPPKLSNNKRMVDLAERYKQALQPK